LDQECTAVLGDGRIAGDEDRVGDRGREHDDLWHLACIRARSSRRAKCKGDEQKHDEHQNGSGCSACSKSWP